MLTKFRVEFHSKLHLYYSEVLTPEGMKLLESIKESKCKNVENVQRLEITELVLVYCNIVHNQYQYDSGVWMNLPEVSHSASY